MFDHIGLKVKDVGASVRFYEAALAPLGYVVCCQDESSAGLGKPGEPVVWLYAANGGAATAAHVGIRATERTLVDRFHRGGLEGGGRDHGKPGVRADYSPTYYAAFLIDPDGNNIEAVCP